MVGIARGKAPYALLASRACFQAHRAFLCKTLFIVLLVLLVVGVFHVEFVGKSCPVRLFVIGIHVCGVFLVIIHTY